jgi:4-aminobutyrate aminotransferase/(S)-3-amino-2-methylpropionate transaminase
VKVELMEALARLSPWADARIVLGSSGSEAVEAALKTALMVTGKPGIVAFEGAYHGLTLGSLAATARDHFREPFRERLYPGVRFVAFPDPLRTGSDAGERALEELAQVLGEGAAGAEIGAVIVEPIQGRAGVRIPPPGFLHSLATLTREAGAVLVFDEIFTGLGRTGSLFTCEREEVLPDLLCLGKGLGGGLPLSACMGPREIMDAWPASAGEAIHTSTFLGHPLACAAGLSLLEELSRLDLVRRSAEEGAVLLRALQRGFEPVPEVAEVRGRGLFIGIDLAEPTTLDPIPGAGAAVAEAALKQGVLVLPAGEFGHVIELSPPLTITSRQLEWVGNELVEIVAATLRSLHRRPR